MQIPPEGIDSFFDYLRLVLQQFSGGPGPLENNLVRFGLPAALWGLLLVLAYSRYRKEHSARERLLAWGFLVGFAREAFMFIHVSLRILNPGIYDCRRDGGGLLHRLPPPQGKMGA